MTLSDDRKRAVFDRTALVPIGACVVLLTSTITVCFWLNGKFSDVTLEISGLKRDVQEIRVTLAVPQWSLRDQKNWSATLKAANPTMNVPDVQ